MYTVNCFNFIDNFLNDHYPFVKSNLVIELVKRGQFLLIHYLRNRDLQNLIQQD